MNWQIRVLLIESIISLLFGCSTCSQSNLKVLEFPKFPISANKEYLVKIISNTQNINIDTKLLLDAIVFEISDKKSKEKAIINYGFKNVENTFRGENLIIRNWKKLDDIQMIVINISFTKLAQNKMLNIYHISPLTGQQRQDLLRDLTTEKPIFSSLIELLIPPKLDLFIRSVDGNIGELTLNQIGFAVCRAYEGEPSERPILVNLHEFNVKSSNFSVERNEREMQFNVSIENHLKEISCKAGDTSKSAKIVVFHPPSQIILKPEPGSYFYRGSKIDCAVLDGYPIPDVRWNFVKGPMDSKKFYTISKDGKILNMNLDAPLKSNWTFNCTATNILPGAQGQISKTIFFEIEEKSNQKNNSFVTSDKCDLDIGSIFKNEFKIYNDKLKMDMTELRTVVSRLRNDVQSCINNEQLPITPYIPTQTNSTFEWYFENFYSLRVLYSTFSYYTSNAFHIAKVKSKFRIWFQHNMDTKFAILRFWVHVFPVSFVPIKYEHKEFNASIEICNAINLNLCKRVTKTIPKNAASQNYDFVYLDLAISGIFYGDSILIKYLM